MGCGSEDCCCCGCDFCVGFVEVHIVCVDAAIALEVDIEGCDFGSEWARKIVRKLAKNGLWVGMIDVNVCLKLHVYCLCSPASSRLTFP